MINRVGINAYVKGVIPNESIPSWPMKALRAQAVASRTFALSGGRDGDGFDLYNDTRSQVYGPISTEYARTSRAASQTSNQIVTYKGDPVLTVFSSSSGGHTENAENVFFGGPVPYLKGVKDPFDSVSPYYRWTVNFSNADMNARLGGYVQRAPQEGQDHPVRRLEADRLGAALRDRRREQDQGRPVPVRARPARPARFQREARRPDRPDLGGGSVGRMCCPARDRHRRTQHGAEHRSGHHIRGVMHPQIGAGDGHRRRGAEQRQLQLRREA